MAAGLVGRLLVHRAAENLAQEQEGGTREVRLGQAPLEQAGAGAKPLGFPEFARQIHHAVYGGPQRQEHRIRSLASELFIAGMGKERQIFISRPPWRRRKQLSPAEFDQKPCHPVLLPASGG